MIVMASSSLLPVSEAQVPFAQEIAVKNALAWYPRADVSNERLGKLIRNAEKDKIPVMAVVGAKEESNGLSSFQLLGELGMPVTEVLEKMERAIANHDNFGEHKC